MRVVHLSVRLRGLLLVAAAAILWGTSGLSAAFAYRRGVEPLTLSFWRMAIGACASLPLLVRSRPTGSVGLSAPRLAIAGIGLAGYQAGFFLAVDRAGVSLATLLTLGLAPIVVTAADRVLTRTQTSRVTLAGVGLAVVGLAALVGGPGDGGDQVVAGAVFAAGSAVGYASLTVAARVLGQQLGVRRLTPVAFACAALVLLPVAATATGMSVPGDPVTIGVLVYLGTIPTALAYWCFFAGLQSTAAPVAAVLALLEPLTATALAIPLLGERLTVVGWAGAAMLLVAVTLVTTTPDATTIASDPA